MGQLHKNIISMKWIDKMVERITRKETALNDRFLCKSAYGCMSEWYD